MEYRNFGPFQLPLVVGERKLDFSLDGRKQFWSSVKTESGHDLQKARGCYLYVIRAGQGWKPWYVGQSKTGFAKEVFTNSKQDYYTEVHESYKKGTPMMFLITRLTKGGKFMTGTLGKNEANYVEQFFIIRAYRKNSNLKNVKGVKIADELFIPGIFNDNTSQKKLNGSTKDLMSCLNL